MNLPAFSRGNVDPPSYVDRVLRAAAEQGASDLYWLPSESGYDLRIRAGGGPYRVADLPREFGETCVARLKVLGGLLTYRKRIAQDGAIRIDDLEIRLSVMPTALGERAALRFLQPGQGQTTLEELGFPDDVTAQLRHMLDAPTGMIVLTGPTGSGKSTTIYALIHELLRSQQDPAGMITLEDPIERVIPGVSQTHVATDREWDYAAALRAALRQDVKTLVVGEMRDPDIVALTLDAALTGHRVITTYHAGDIPSVYARLLHQGFEPFLVAAALTGVVTQRLVPRSDGSGSIPVVGTLTPDDAWRELVIGNPGLSALRKEIARYPLADLAAAARRCGESADLTDADRARILRLAR